jgi:membrane protein
VLNQQDPAVAMKTLSRAIQFIAPQVTEYEHVDRKPRAPAANPAETPREAKPALARLMERFVSGHRSGTAGVVGAVTLILIVIQLCSSVESAFNGVWGVRRGRSWLVRIVFYWAIISLGAVLFFTSLTALSAAAFINVFFERLPFGGELLRALRWMLPAFSAGLVVVLLTLFYRYIPNTRVFWIPALIGAVFVTALLYLNNYLAFLYFKRVVVQQSLYGSLGILPILMLGLYIFWFFVLVGGQLSYAVQNARHHSSQMAWQNLSASAQESLALLVLLAICRRFKSCQPAYSASEIGQIITVPTQLLTESLNHLVDLGLVTLIPPAERQPATENRYQPARPLARITLAEFKQLFDNHGEHPGGALFDAADPGLRYYHERLTRSFRESLGSPSLDELLDKLPAARGTTA